MPRPRASKKFVYVSLGRELADAVQQIVASGEYGSEADFVRMAVMTFISSDRADAVQQAERLRVYNETKRFCLQSVLAFLTTLERDVKNRGF